jgi:DNA-binding CsgD family transcriptional regulator
VKKADSEPSKARARPRTPNQAANASSRATTVRLLDTMPVSDPAYPIVAGILSVVPVSRWAFARLESGGEFVSLFGSNADGTSLAGLADEFKRQRTEVATGPRIAATLGSLGDFASGITLLFADARSNYGILSLLRTTELGPFTSSEISMLTFALDAASDLLSALRLQPQPKAETPGVQGTDGSSPECEPAEGAHYLLGRDLQIVLAWSSEDQRRIALTGLHTRIAERLPPLIEDTVRELTAAWSTDSVKRPGVARPVPFLVVRTQPMTGPAGLFIGVQIDRFHPPNSLIGAAAQFHISPREVQVLALLLDGNHLDQIATQLHITSSTVQDHIKSMLDKTESRNRSELIARVLGWESTPTARQA